MRCDSALDICGINAVDCVLDQQLSWSGGGEVTEDKAEFLDAQTGLEAASKHTCQFGIKDSNVVMCSKVANEVYRQNSRRKLANNTYRLLREINIVGCLTLSCFFAALHLVAVQLPIFFLF